MSIERQLVLASGNPHKVKELREMIVAATLPVRLVVRGMSEFGDPPEIPEVATTFVGNAGLKAGGIATWLQGREGIEDGDLVLADDSGICIDVFDGAPGVYSARYSGPNATDAENNAKMVAELQRLDVTRSPAHYACALCMVRVDLEPMGMWTEGGARIPMKDGAVVRGRCEGEVRVEARGTGGFGYDPHFWLDDGARTMAELDPIEKAKIGHRGDALRRLLAVLPALLQPAAH